MDSYDIARAIEKRISDLELEKDSILYSSKRRFNTKSEKEFAAEKVSKKIEKLEDLLELFE